MPNPYQKFKVDFSHEQKLQDARGKLSHALTILTNMRDTLGLIGDHSKAMVNSKSIPAAEHIYFQRDLDNLSQDIQCYIRTSEKLLRMSDDLKSMASHQTPDILQMAYKFPICLTLLLCSTTIFSRSADKSYNTKTP